MTQELFIKLNELVSENTPTQIIKRGNAFSLSSISEKDELKNEYSKYSFSGLNIYQSQINDSRLLLKGEAFFTQGINELDMEVEVSLPASSDELNKLRILEYIFDLSENFISLKIETSI